MRTLLIAIKVLDEEEISSTLRAFYNADLDFKDRDRSLDSVYDKLERGLTLLGATAVEDLLQEEVSSTIFDL